MDSGNGDKLVTTMKEDVSILRPSSIEDIFFSYYGCLEMSPKSTNAEHGLDNVILNIPDDLDESNLFNSDEDVLRTIDLSEFEDNTSENLEQLDNLLKDSILEDYSDSYSVLGVNLNLSCNITSEGMVNHNDGINIIGNLDPWVEETVDNIVYKELLTNTSFDNVLAENAQEISRGNLPLQSTDAEIYNQLPPITEEKNVKRRSLLYERSVKLDNPHNENLNNNNNSNKKYQALMTHDYTHRRSEDNKFFPCSVVNCDRVYSKSSHLKAHLKRHSGEKPFVCNWNNCTWKFSRSDELARHRRSHLGIKPYKCELCERAFARSDHLAKHHKVHKRKMAQFGNFQIKRRIRLK